ncbi:MAG: phosphoserine phosphatase SerB [Nitrososphaerales archaeon]
MIVIFDVEGVLVDGEFFPELAKLLDMEEEITEITMKGIRGEIDWKDGLMQRLERVKGVPYESCLKVCDNLPYMKGAKEVCNRLKSWGWIIVAVSGGPTLLSGRVARELSIDHVYGNDLIFKEGKLETMDVYVDSDKSAAVKSLVRELREKKENTFVVIDGANDLKLVELAGVSVAFNASPLVEECTDYTVKEKDLSLLLPILERRSEARIEAARRLDA